MIKNIDQDLLEAIFSDDEIIDIEDEYVGTSFDFDTFFTKAAEISGISEDNIRKNYMSEFMKQNREDFGTDTVQMLGGIKMFTLNLFKDCIYIRDIVVPDSVNFVGEGAFENSDLTEFETLKSTGLRGVGKNAFKDCSMLKSVDLSNTTVDIIKSGTFENCPNLKKVIFPRTLKEIEVGAFKGTPLCENAIDFRSYTDPNEEPIDPLVPELEGSFYNKVASKEMLQ